MAASFDSKTMDMTSYLKNFVQQFSDSLAVEFRFVEDISHGLADNRPDAVQRHLGHLFTVINFVGDNVLPFGSGMVSMITNLTKKHLQDKNNKNIQNFAAELTKHKPDKRTFLFDQIAREVMYRYGPCICHLIALTGPNNATQALDRLARTGAIRIIFYAMRNNISFEQCDKLVTGLVDGFEDFPEKDMLSKMLQGALSALDGKQTVRMSSEGLYTRSGFMSPGNSFWIHQDYDRQSGKDGKLSGYVTFNPSTNKKTSNAAADLSEAIRRADYLVPKYGYIAVPSAAVPIGYHYRKHHPSNPEALLATNADNHHLSFCMRFKYRYVSLEHIQDYLADMKATAVVNDRVPFNDWLLQSKTHGTEFTAEPGFKIEAVFRGVLNGKSLLRSGLNFADGTFSHVDFSYSTFLHITFHNIQSSKLVGCKFVECTATSSAISGSDLSCSIVDQCDFQRLCGALKLKYGILSQSTFAGSSFTVHELDGIEYDDHTLQTFNNSRNDSNGATGSAAGDEKLYEMLIENKLKQDQLNKLLKEKEEAQLHMEQDRAAQRDLLTNLMEADSAKEKNRGDKVARIEAELLRMQKQMNERMTAFDKDTMVNSIDSIQTPVVNLDNPLTKVFEVLFFLKPMKLLRLLQNNPDVVKWSALPRSFTYSTNGEDGLPGTDGEHGLPGAFGGGAGTDAVLGVNGQHATSATPNTVCIMSVPGQKIFVVSPKAPEVDAVVLPLYDGAVNVNLSCKGGAGGKGGDGGRGGDGTNGINGQNATGSSNGSSGTAGGNGGRGGNGGMGGNAGHSSDLTIMVKEDDVDLLSVLGKLAYDVPKGGVKGNFGLGGAGGIGGKGGDSCRTMNGNKVIVNSGGVNGANGVPGHNGKDGQPGLDGKCGTLTIKVVDVESGEMKDYHQLYKYELNSMATFSSATGIIEPGQKVEVSNVVISNKGGMPTPRSVEVSLKGNSHMMIDHDDCSWMVNEVIFPGKTHTITDPLYFKISDDMQSANLAEVLFVETELNIAAKIPRTNANCRDFQMSKISLGIMHPVEISVVTGVRTSVFDTHVPVTVTVRNKSRLGFGMAATYGRLVRVSIDLPISSDASEGNHIYRTSDNGLGGFKLNNYSTNSQLSYDIDYLAPQSEMVLTGTFCINPAHVRLYDQIPLLYSLSLGNIDLPLQVSSMEVIQQKTHKFQVGEYCQPIGENDCLLIISSVTTAEEVNYWRDCFHRIGKGMCVFNVSLYHGVTYKFPSFNFCESLSERIVVILNAPFYRDDVHEYFTQEFYPLDYLEQSEMFEAARHHGVRTLVVNYTASTDKPSPHHTKFSSFVQPLAKFDVDQETKDATAFDGRNKLYLSIEEAGATRDEHLPEAHQHCRIKLFRAVFKPNENDFNRRIDVMAGKVKTVRPDHQYFVSKAFHPPEKGTSKKVYLWSRYDIGEVELRRGLDTTYATMASTTVTACDPLIPKTSALFVLLKLLPFAEKLRLFTTVEPEETIFAEIANALASDIADEQQVFINYVRSNILILGAKKERMLTWLTALLAFGNQDFSEMCNREGGTGITALTDFLFKLCYLSKQYGDGVLMMQTKFMAVNVQDICFKLFKSYLGVLTEEDFLSRLAENEKTQKATNANDALLRTKDPHNVAKYVLFNHWLPVASTVITEDRVPRDPATVTLMRSRLPDMGDEIQHSKAMSFFSQRPVYHIPQLPKLFPVHPNDPVIPEVAGKKQSYFVRGLAPVDI